METTQTSKTAYTIAPLHFILSFLESVICLSISAVFSTNRNYSFILSPNVLSYSSISKSSSIPAASAGSTTSHSPPSSPQLRSVSNDRSMLSSSFASLCSSPSFSLSSFFFSSSTLFSSEAAFLFSSASQFHFVLTLLSSLDNFLPQRRVLAEDFLFDRIIHDIDR